MSQEVSPLEHASVFTLLTQLSQKADPEITQVGSLEWNEIALRRLKRQHGAARNASS